MEPKTREALAAFFPNEALGARPGHVGQNGKASVLFYVQTDEIIKRLNDVLGPENWQVEYTPFDRGVKCSLSVWCRDRWVTKEDFGGYTEMPDKSDTVKTGATDALKRAAKNWGIGLYLNSLPAIWADYDSQKKRFPVKPQVPVAFLPKQQAQPQRQPTPPANGTNGTKLQSQPVPKAG